MTIKTYKDGYGDRHYVLCTDCRSDAGMETAWVQVNKAIQSNDVKAEVAKIASKLTKRPDSWSVDHNLRVGVRAAERYCLGKLLSGETEDADNTSGNWDALKDAIPSDFNKHFSIREVYSRVKEYFIDIAGCNNACIEDPKALIHYGPGLLSYTHDMSRASVLKQAMSNANRYYKPEVVKSYKDLRAKFEALVARVDVDKFTFTAKDTERIIGISKYGEKASNHAYTMADKIKDPNKALARWVASIANHTEFTQFRNRAVDLGIPKAVIEAISRKRAGKKVYNTGLLPNDPEFKSLRSY